VGGWELKPYKTTTEKAGILFQFTIFPPSTDKKSTPHLFVLLKKWMEKVEGRVITFFSKNY
jgi:hypothetical protein